VDFYVKLYGTAVVSNKADILPDTNEVHGGKLLLKMVPYYIEYTQTDRKVNFSGLKKIGAQVHDFFSPLPDSTEQGALIFRGL